MLAASLSVRQTAPWINSGGLGLPWASTCGGIRRQAGAAGRNRGSCVTGDGSIQMNIQELSTALQYNPPVVVVNLVTGYLGMVKQ